MRPGDLEPAQVEERVAGIVPPAGATVEQRRAALRAKWRSSGKATLAQIQAVAESWESQRVETSFLAGVIGIDVINLRQGTVAEIREAVEKIKPAHLPLENRGDDSMWRPPSLWGRWPGRGTASILWEVDRREMIPSVKLTAAGAALLAKVPAGSGAPVTRWADRDGGAAGGHGPGRRAPRWRSR